MDKSEEVLNEMDKPEWKEKIDKWASEYLVNETIKDNKIKKMLSNTDYIKWLNKFTLEHQSFSDNDWLCQPEKISDSDNIEVRNLNLIYSGIHKYASKNYIYPIPCDYGNYYRIKFDDIGYEIGRLIGKGTIFFCNRVELKDSQTFIDFNDIVSDKVQNNVRSIEVNLNNLSYMVLSLYKNGIPFEAISDTLDKTLNKIKEENNLEKVKTLKK